MISLAEEKNSQIDWWTDVCHWDTASSREGSNWSEEHAHTDLAKHTGFLEALSKEQVCIAWKAGWISTPMWLFDDYTCDILPFDEGSRDSLTSVYYASHKNVVDSRTLYKLANKPYIRNMLTKTCIIILLVTNIEVRVVISCHFGPKGEEGV